jgi:hypothetical protein
MKLSKMKIFYKITIFFPMVMGFVTLFLSCFALYKDYRNPCYYYDFLTISMIIISGIFFWFFGQIYNILKD